MTSTIAGRHDLACAKFSLARGSWQVLVATRAEGPWPLRAVRGDECDGRVALNLTNKRTPAEAGALRNLNRVCGLQDRAETPEAGVARQARARTVAIQQRAAKVPTYAN